MGQLFIYLFLSLVGVSGAIASAGGPRPEPWPNGLVCIRAVGAAGAEVYDEKGPAFADWLGNYDHSFYIADITIAPVEQGSSTFQYRLGVSNPDHEARILRFAQQFDSGLNISTTLIERPLVLTAPELRWADWFPSRASLGHVRPDRLGDFARTLLRGIEGVFYVETEQHYNIQVFARPQQAADPSFAQRVTRKLQGLPGTVTIRADTSHSRIHQALTDRTTPAVLHAIRTQPDGRIDVSLEPYPGEGETFAASIAAIMKIPGVSFYDLGSEQFDAFELQCGPGIFASLPARTVADFVEYFSIKKILLAPQDCN